MKKTLIAMAAVAVAGTASAQVNISGRLTVDAYETGKTTTLSAADVTTSTKTKLTGGQDGVTTSQLTFSGAEDLGAGLTASFRLDTGMASNGIGNRDTYLELGGGFGSVRLGRFVPNASYGFYGFSGPATTQVGSIYAVGGAGSLAVTGVVNTAGSFERNDNQLQYTSPSINGLTINLNYGTNISDASANIGQAETKQQGVSVAYTAGPLSVAYGTNSRNVDTEGVAAVLGQKLKGDLDWFGGSYDFGVAKVTFANVQRKDSTAAITTNVVTVNSDIDVNSVGVSVPMDAFTFTASMYNGDNAASALSTDNWDLSGSQLMANYTLSKRTSVYAVTGNNTAKRAGGNTAGIATKTTVTSVGMLHTF